MESYILVYDVLWVEKSWKKLAKKRRNTDDKR